MLSESVLQSDFEKWSRIIARAAINYGARKPVTMSDEYSDGMLGLCHAVKKWDGVTCPFDKFALPCIHKQILQGIEHRMAKKRRPKDALSIEFFDETNTPKGGCHVSDVEYLDLVQALRSKVLSSVSLRTVDMLADGHTTSDIARVDGVNVKSIQARIRHYIRPILKQLLEGKKVTYEKVRDRSSDVRRSRILRRSHPAAAEPVGAGPDQGAQCPSISHAVAG